MPISFSCKNCGKRLKAPESAAGKSSNCPGCGRPVTCPSPRSMDEEPDVPEILDDIDPYADLDDGSAYRVPDEPAEAAESRMPCPMCGEMIASSAVKCRFCGEMLEKSPKPVAGPKKKKKIKSSGYAGFWLRFVAMIVDGFVVLAIIRFPLSLISGAPMFRAQPPTVEEAQRDLFVSLVSFVLQIAYFAVMEASSYQGTLGKMALGLKVTDLNGYPISVGRGIGRNLGKILSALICLIGYIMAAFSERKQAMHDMMAGTLVVRSR